MASACEKFEPLSAELRQLRQSIIEIAEIISDNTVLEHTRNRQNLLNLSTPSGLLERVDEILRGSRREGDSETTAIRTIARLALKLATIYSSVEQLFVTKEILARIADTQFPPQDDDQETPHSLVSSNRIYH